MSARPNECKARQYSDQMRCLKCGMVWDTNDPEPPECKPEPAITCELRGVFRRGMQFSVCPSWSGGKCHSAGECEHKTSL